MISLSGRVFDSSEDVLALQIRMIFEDFFNRSSRAEEVQNVGDWNPHSANARPAPALCGIESIALDVT